MHLRDISSSVCEFLDERCAQSRCRRRALCLGLDPMTKASRSAGTVEATSSLEDGVYVGAVFYPAIR